MKSRATLLAAILLIILQQGGCKGPSGGTDLPDVAVQDLAGATVKLTQFVGKPMIINFWATWCGPCRIEIPMLNALHKKYAQHGVVILGISTDENGANVVQEFTKEVPIEYPNYLKTDGVEEKFGGVWALPTTFFYDRNGKQVQKIIGLQPQEELEKRIQQMLRK